MKAYAYNTLGEFLGEVDCQPNPLVLGEFIVPAQATAVEPPKQKAGKVRTWNGSKWVYVDIVTSDAPMDESTDEIAE